MIKRAVVVLLLLGTAVAFQQVPIPEHQPDGNPQHDHQPEFCQNYDTGVHAHNCTCHAMNPTEQECDSKARGQGEEDEDGNPVPEGRESPRCRVYCRKSACRCRNHCGG